jgi:hypothetical protein
MNFHMGEPHAGERRDREVAAGPLAKQEAQRRGGNGIEGPGPRLREATQSHAFESPSPGECRDTRTARPDGEHHSARVGAAQDLLALNMDLASVMQAGRWRDTRMPMRYGEKVLAGRGAMARAAKAQGRA